MKFDCVIALKALAEENRLRILRCLLHRQYSVTGLADELGLTTYNVSKHLRILREAGLVECVKDGQQRLHIVAADFQTHLKENNQVLDLGCCLFHFDQLPG